MKVKGKKFRLVLDKNTIINDGTTVYTYNKEANEVNLSDPAEMDQELDPSKLFTQYEKGFKSTFVDEKADAAGVTVQTIKLFPLEPTKKAFHTVVISVDKAKVEPKSYSGALQGWQPSDLQPEEIHCQSRPGRCALRLRQEQVSGRGSERYAVVRQNQRTRS